MARTMLVTGATGGIGAAVVRAAAKRGYQVVAVGRDGGRLDALAAEVPGITGVVLDLGEPFELPPRAAALERVDAVVHCAGVAEVATVGESSFAGWHETLGVNLVAAAELTRMMLPALRRARGHVVFVNAAPGVHAVPRWAAYAGSKAALRELADSLREEEKGNGLRVTTIYPGGTATDLLRKVREQFGHPFRAADCIQAPSLASLVLMTLDMPPDAYLSEVSVLPAPGR
jgi:NADP-dependent 3-hydroxy acid dehydrogenase YdfG